MTAEFVNTATPPSEVSKALRKSGLPTGEIKGWYAIPSFAPFSRGTMQIAEQVDAYGLLPPNWKGGRGEIKQGLGISVQRLIKKFTEKPKPNTIV